MIATGHTEVTRWTDVRWDRLALAAVVAGLAIRAIWVFGVHPPLDYIYSDMEGFVSRATTMANGGPWDRSLVLKAPGTSLLLAIPLRLLGTGRTGLWGAAGLWWAFSSVTPFLAWRWARYLFSPAAAAAGAWLCALYPLHITFAGYFLSETPSLALLMATLVVGCLLHRAEPRQARTLAIYLGLLMGLVTVVRSPLVFNLLVVVVGLLPRIRRDVEILGRIILGGLLVLGPVLVLNTRAAGEFVGMSDYDALNFFMGHCDARQIEGKGYRFGSPVHSQLNRGGDYLFSDRTVGDKGFYLGRAVQCIRRNGIGHLGHVARSMRDLTYPTVPWPQSGDLPVRSIASATNQVYSALLPIIVGGTLLAARRERRPLFSTGRGIVLVHLACVLMTAILFFGDPRYRSTYDVFGLILLAALSTDLMLSRPRTAAPEDRQHPVAT